MFRAFGIAFGLALGFATINQSRYPGGSSFLVGVAVVVAVLAAYYIGRNRRPMAVAIASANAEATATAQSAVVVNVYDGARTAAAARWGALDEAIEWQAESLGDVPDADVFELMGPEEMDLSPLTPGVAGDGVRVQALRASEVTPQAKRAERMTPDVPRP